MLIQAAEAPCRRLLENAGQEAAGAIIADILSNENGAGFDVQAGRAVNTMQSGVVDSAAALMAAARNSISGAALALTIDTIVHRVNPPLAIEPGGLPASTDLGDIELR